MSDTEIIFLVALVLFVVAWALIAEWRSVGRAVRRIGVMPERGDFWAFVVSVAVLLAIAEGVLQ